MMKTYCYHSATASLIPPVLRGMTTEAVGLLMSSSLVQAERTIMVTQNSRATTMGFTDLICHIDELCYNLLHLTHKLL